MSYFAYVEHKEHCFVYIINLMLIIYQNQIQKSKFIIHLNIYK